MLSFLSQLRAFALILSLLLCAAAQATTYYVSPQGSDANDGLAPERALLTPQRAADCTEPGDSVLFAGGTYEVNSGQGLLVVTRSGAEGKPILYAAMPDQKPLLRVRGAWHAIKIVSARYIEIRGFKVQGMAGEITLEEARREMSNLGNPRTSGNGIGIVDDKESKIPPAHITVRDCEVSDFGGGGIFSTHADYLTIENNVVARCGFWAPYANSGISVYQPIDVDEATGYKIIIRNNVSFENYNQIPFYYSNKDDASKRKVTDGNGIILDDYRNTQAFGGGQGKPYGGRTLVANNVVFRNGGSGIHAYLSTNVDIVHNYAADNNRHPGIKDGQIFANTSSNVRVLNNVLIAPPGKPVSMDYKNESVIYDFNLYAVSDGLLPIFARERASNVFGDPKLKLYEWETGRRDLFVAPDSPLRRAATPFKEAGADFFGKARSDAKSDIGPFVINAPPIISPEIHADRSVTFRVRAPKASEVKVSGEWGAGANLNKGDYDVWSATVGPIAPDLYGYNFNIDGVTLLDPSNTFAKPMRSSTTSILDIPGQKPTPADRIPGVPRGTVTLHEYDSKSLGKTRRLRVYTPAAYESNRKSRFPVLYLLHGSGDNEATWTEFGRANVILDNLIAAKKAVPMIVIMTDGHAVTGSTPEARGQNAPAFARDFLEDVMPFVESRYRIRAEREHRAIAGLSMGGNQAFTIGLNHRHLFAWVIGMSSAIREPEKQLPVFLAAPNDRKTPLRLLWLGIGKDDFLLKENRAFDALLTAKQVPHEYHETSGNHSWPIWRRYLAEVAPRLFAR